MSLSPEQRAAAQTRAQPFIDASRPRSASHHLWRDAGGWRLFVANGSQLFDIESAAAQQLLNAAETAPEALLQQLGVHLKPLIDDREVEAPPLFALSLAVAQKCNLGCQYCYAQQGSFGAAPRNMDEATARAAVDLLLSEAGSAARANLAFLGGEPLINRRLLRATTEYAADQAAQRGIALSFSVTSNGTLLDATDADFFERYGFAVTISLDGAGETHDRLRPFRNGRGSYARILQRLEPLLQQQRRMQVSARVTVTAQNQDLPATLNEFVALGFHSVGFSPLLRSPNGQSELDADELQVLLGQMIACGELSEQAWREGRRFPFANLHNALHELRRGTHRPYPCGAGAAYLGVSAEGELSACHRFVGDREGALGSLQDGIDRSAQSDWLRQRHVHRQSPCQQCWARYLCGGGCHHEVIARGRPACDYIRGWLQYCLQASLRVSSEPAAVALRS